MHRQLLVFDLDGTLADSRADLATAVNLMRAHYSLPPLSLDTIESYVGNGVRQLVARSLQDTGVDVAEALPLYKQFYTEHMLDATALYPGVAQGLRRLAESGHLLAVLSNKPGDPSRTILHHLGAGPLFAWILGGGDLPNLKPAPDGLLALVAATGMPPQKVWMIGDHHTDLEAARNAGVKSGFVTYGIGNPGGFRADQVWNSFEELVDFFANKRSVL
ncbi:MAG TPA: HAD hydrolase-like protein [Pontiellaceae bacterium]|nr:HAD hydrolase-like protein [Pontiellaceae bacterium]HPR83002.1 HAD hydrolase-like protein [Pontiellaceae bacterium]